MNRFPRYGVYPCQHRVNLGISPQFSTGDDHEDDAYFEMEALWVTQI